MASEEMDTIHRIPSHFPKGRNLLLFDPLDGSSNIDVNVSIGTIFSVLQLPEEAHSRDIQETDFYNLALNRSLPAMPYTAPKPCSSSR